MPIERQDLTARLRQLSDEQLAGLLALTGKEASADAPEERIAAQLWWAWCTPLGYVVDTTTLDQMVDVLAKKLDVLDAAGDDDAVDRLGRLTSRLALDAQQLADGLPDDVKKQLKNPWMLSGVSLGGATASLGATHLGAAILKLGAGPIGRLLPLIPAVAKWWKPIRAGAGVAASAGGPLAIVLALAAANQALGRRYEKALPLLIGMGALAEDLRPVS